MLKLVTYTFAARAILPAATNSSSDGMVAVTDRAAKFSAIQGSPGFWEKWRFSFPRLWLVFGPH